MTTLDTPTVGAIADELRPAVTFIAHLGYNAGVVEAFEAELRRRGLDPAKHPLPRHLLKPVVGVVPPEVAELLLAQVLADVRRR